MVLVKDSSKYSDRPAVVLFALKNSPKSQRIKKILEKISESYGNRILFIFEEIDRKPFDLKRIPWIFLRKRGSLREIPARQMTEKGIMQVIDEFFPKVEIITDETFQSLVKDSSLPVILMLKKGNLSGPIKRLLTELADLLGDRIKFAYADLRNKGIAKKFGKSTQMNLFKDNKRLVIYRTGRKKKIK